MAIFSLSGFDVSELHAINTQSPSETNLTPAAVTGGLHVIISNNDVTSSSDNLKNNKKSQHYLFDMSLKF